MEINIESILNKLEEKNKNNEFEKQIKKAKTLAFKEGKPFGISNSNENILDNYSVLAQDYLESLKTSIPSSEQALIKIINEAISNAIISKPISISKDLFKIEIDFNDKSLKRKSLHYEDGVNDYYTGKGIKNIIALFNNGYKINNDKKPYGLWESHNKEVAGRKHREALQFMQKSRDDFLTKNKDKNNKLDVKLNNIYTKK